MKIKNRIISNQKGSLIGSMMALSIMGLSTVGLLHYMTGFKSNVVEQVQQRDNEVLISRQAINRLKSLLIEKTLKEDGSTAPQNTYGICSLLESPEISVGTEAIYLNFKYVNTKSVNWSKSRWEAVFAAPDWQLADADLCRRIDSDFTESVFSRCLEYKGDNSGAWQTFVIAKMRPEYFPSGKEINIANKPIDPKLVMFILTAKTGSFYVKTPASEESQGSQQDNSQSGNQKSESVQQGIVYFHQTSDMLWANSAGECHVQTTGGEWTTVYFSGSGTGSNSNNKVINDSRLRDINSCEALEIIDINKDLVQVGQLNNSDLSSVAPLNAKLSCTTNTFRCKKPGGGVPDFSDEDINPFQFTFSIRNLHPYPITITAMNITLKKKNAGEMDGTSNRRLDGISMNLYNNVDDTNSIMAANVDHVDNTYEISGEKEFAVRTNMDSYCQSICQSNNLVYPVIDADTASDTAGTCFKKDFSDDDSNRVQCTVCYMKSCQRTGLGTFGPLHKNAFPPTQLADLNLQQQVLQGLPDEALDSQLPECHITQSYTGSDLPTNALKQVNSGGGTDSCLAVSASNVDDFTSLHSAQRQYHRVNCSTKQPVLCFINGHYVPAVEVNLNNAKQPLTIVETNFAGAQEACFKMGQETGNMLNLIAMLQEVYRRDSSETELKRQSGRVQQNLVSASDNERFEFINNATRGIFLAPVDRTYSFVPNGQIRQVVTKILSKKMWVAIELDDGGSPVASLPWAGVAVDHPWAAFFNKDRADGSRLVLFEDTSQLQGSSSHFALHYNLRWKGVVPQSSTTKTRFICFKPNSGNSVEGKYFITTDEGKLEDGVKICNQEGGFFIPPFSGDDWAHLMLSLNSNDEMYPFPDPDLDNATKTAFIYSHNSLHNPTAWLALESKSSKQVNNPVPKASELNFYVTKWPNGTTSVDSKSVLKTRSMVKLGKKRNGITLDGVPRNTCRDAGDTLLSLCVSPQESGYFPVAIVPEAQSCSSGQKITKANAGTWYRSKSYRYLAKLYQLLHEQRGIYSSQRTKKVNVVVSGMEAPGCMKQCEELKEWKTCTSVQIPGSNPPKFQQVCTPHSAKRWIVCPGRGPHNDPDLFTGSTVQSCTTGSSCKLTITRKKGIL